MLNNQLSNLHERTDNELIELANSGNDDAYSVLVGRYIILVRSCVKSYFSDSHEFDDLMQEGLIGLVNAIKSYDCSCSASFSTFAHLCIDRNIVSAIRKSLRKKQIPSSMLVFIDDEPQLDNRASSQSSINPESRVIDAESYEQRIKFIFSRLSKTEQKVLKLYLHGKTYEQIAKSLNISTKSVGNALCRIRSKLK